MEATVFFSFRRLILVSFFIDSFFLIVELYPSMAWHTMAHPVKLMPAHWAL